MKSRYYLLEILKFAIGFLLLWVLFLLLAAIFSTSGEEEVSDFWNRIAAGVAIITMLIISLVLNFNRIQKMYQNAMGMKSNIEINQTRGNELLSKANRIVDKYMHHEAYVQTTVAKTRANCKDDKKAKVKSAAQFAGVIENYPELKANQNISELCRQLSDCEHIIANTKIEYNRLVTEFNTIIHCFPAVMVKGKKSDLDFYNEPMKMFTDEELGL